MIKIMDWYADAAPQTAEPPPHAPSRAIRVYAAARMLNGRRWRQSCSRSRTAERSYLGDPNRGRPRQLSRDQLHRELSEQLDQHSGGLIPNGDSTSSAVSRRDGGEEASGRRRARERRARRRGVGCGGQEITDRVHRVHGSTWTRRGERVDQPGVGTETAARCGRRSCPPSAEV